MLEITTFYEKGDWEKIDWDYLEAQGLTAEAVAQIYIETLSWVEQTMNDLGIIENSKH